MASKPNKKKTRYMLGRSRIVNDKAKSLKGRASAAMWYWMYTSGAYPALCEVDGE